MKTLFVLALLLFSKLCLAEIALYTSDSKEPQDLDKMQSILERFINEAPEKNILFYVHGRNKNPETERRKIVKMEATYNVKAVMLHWDAWSGVFSRAVKSAEIAADSLNRSFEEIREFKAAHESFFATHKINLLCHSMGNLVLKNFSEKFAPSDDLEEPIFDSYLGVSADVPLKNHKEWLHQFKLARKKIVIMNNADAVLLLSYGLDLTDKNPFYYRLGLGFDNWPGKKDQIKAKLDEEATYIDLSGLLEAQHGYFMPKSKVLKTIFYRLTNGEDFNLDPAEANHLKIKLRTENNIIYLKDS